MITSVDIRVVVMIAAIMLIVAIVLCLLERRTRVSDTNLRHANDWLCAANGALLLSCVTLLLHYSLPFWLSASIIILGAHAGILCAFFAIQWGLNTRPRYGLFATISASILLLQMSLTTSGAGAALLFVSTGIANGLLTLTMGLIILRLSRPHEIELRVLVSFPFFALAFGYVMRLILLAMEATTAVVLTTTALIAFSLAFAALQWCFGLIALRAAWLNQSLTVERQRAQDLAEARARFLAHMSHEIRTPLNSVLGLADVLHGTVKQPEARELVGHIQNSGDLLMHIVNDILDVSKLQANAVTLEQRPFDLDALLRQIAASHALTCREKRLLLDVEIQPGASGFWMGDPHRVNQILQNVIGNAVKFTETGSVRVVARGSDHLTLVVEDTGIGMSEAQVGSMFDEFTQADEGITRRFGGTGLGMSIVHKLTKVMGGQIEVQSAPGQGTRFTITLPLRRAETVEILPIPAAPAAQMDFSTLNVLCADDSKSNLLMLCAMLRQMGIEPQTAEDGHAAIAMTERQSFDLYLLDISMPGLSGIETLHRLRQVEKDGLRPPAYGVAATANALAPDLDLYMASGFDSHLSKPIRLEALRAILLACQQSRLAHPLHAPGVGHRVWG